MLTPLPASLRLRAPLPFVGRAAELRALAAALEPAHAPALVPVVVAGEAGAGKSRLVAEGVSAAAARGARVLHGGCDAVVGVPYGPWVEALAPLVRDDSHGVARALGSAAADLARVLPELRAAAPEPLDADPDTQRHRLHGAVADLLALAAATAPLVVVLEDLHWADGGSIALLRHLARARPAAPVALVVTLRHGPADAGDELADALADLRRRDGVVRLDLGGLSAGEVDDLLARLAGAGDRELAAGLHDLTGGNPFLLGELWRSLHERGDLAVVDGRVVLARPLADLESPAAVREVTGRRIARLDADAAALLEAAAVIGREVPVDLLAAVLGTDEAALAGPLASAVAAGVLVEAPPPALRLRFAHELVRRALADRLDGLRRATLHLRVAEALDDPAVAPSQERRSAALAHHFTAAAAVGGRARAAHHHIEAARAASLALAYAEAARHLQTALELGIAEPAKRGAAELELGLALNRAGEVRGAVAAFGAAAATARALGDAMLLAEAAIGLEDTCWRPGLADAGASALLREAATALGDRDDALVVRVRGALARALTVEGGDRAEAAALGEQAIAGARRSGDPRALGQALVRAYWAKGDASRGDVLAALTEARDLGAELGDVELRAEAMAWRTVTLAAAGRVAEAHAEASALRAAAGRARQPFMLHAAEQFTSALRLCAGDLDGAEAAARRSREWRRALHEPLADGAFGLQMFAVERERGTLGSLVPAAVVRAAATDAGGRWEPGRIALLAELGLIADARDALAALVASEGADAVPPDALGLAGATYLAEAAALVGDRRAAALLERRLAPLAGELVVVGHLVACQGAADRFLGILAAVGGRADEAEARLRAALALDRRTGPTWTAHSALALAELLERRDGDGDGAEALALRREARALAEAHGLGRVVRRLGARAAVPAPADELPAGLSPREVVILRRLADGRTNREIGAALVISQHTVANHVRSILRKTGSANRAEAVSFAHRHGLAP